MEETPQLPGEFHTKIQSDAEPDRKSASLKQVISFVWAGEEGHVLGKGLAGNAALKSNVLKMTRSKKQIGYCLIGIHNL